MDQDDVDAQSENIIEAMRQMYLNGVLDGSAEAAGTYFYPDNQITRAEVSKIITKCLFNLDEDITVIEAKYKNIDGFDEDFIKFDEELTDPSTSNAGYWFTADRDGYYFIAVKGNNGNKVEFDLYDSNQNIIEDDFTKLYIDEFGESEIPSYITNSMIDGDYMNYRYYLNAGQVAFIRNISCVDDMFSIKVTEPQDGDIVFRPDGDGYFIYASNPEYVGASHLINVEDNDQLLMRVDV